MCNKFETPEPYEFVSLVGRVIQMLPELNQYDEVPLIKYDDPNARGAYLNAASGILHGIVCKKEDYTFNCSDIKRIFENAHSELAKAAALNVYKKARAIVFDERYESHLREALFAVLEEIKSEKRNFGEPHDIVGSRKDPIRWIYAYENGPMMREVTVKSKKRGIHVPEV